MVNVFIREMRSKMTLKYHLIASRKAKIKTQVTVRAGKAVEEGKHSSIDGGSSNSYSHHGIYKVGPQKVSNPSPS